MRRVPFFVPVNFVGGKKASLLQTETKTDEPAGTEGALFIG